MSSALGPFDPELQLLLAEPVLAILGNCLTLVGTTAVRPDLVFPIHIQRRVGVGISQRAIVRRIQKRASHPSFDHLPFYWEILRNIRASRLVGGERWSGQLLPKATSSTTGRFR